MCFLAMENVRPYTDINQTIGEISLCGELVDNPGMDRSQMRSLRDFGLVYVYTGNGSYCDEGGQAIEVLPGALIFLWPGQPHHYGPQSGSWSEIYFLFRGPMFELWRTSGCLSENRRVLQLTPVEHWLERFRELLRRVKAAEGESSQQVLLSLNALLQIWTETVAGQSNATETNWASRARQLMRGRLTDADAVRSVAQELRMGYESFRKRFAQECGESPGKYLRKERLIAAAMRLESTRQSVAEISEYLGFCDPFHFSRQFSRHFGCSPLQYRQRQHRRMKNDYPVILQR